MEVEQLPPLEHQRVVNFTRELAHALRRISELSDQGQLSDSNNQSMEKEKSNERKKTNDKR